MQGTGRTISAIIVVAVLTVMTACLPQFDAAVRADSLSALPWRTQGMQAWGRKNVAVDFGARGLWNYSGVWVQLSRLDPRHMAAWGDGNLAIDFGEYGLWTYDGRTWLKITF
jgi:hypothetical protein